MRLPSWMFITLFVVVMSAMVSAQDYPYGVPVKKPLAWKGWELHGAVSTSIPNYEYWTVSQSYQRDNGGTFRFIRDDGTVVRAQSFNSSRNPDEPLVNDKLYQLGLNRVTSWGGSFRLSLGYYRSVFRIRGDDFTGLREDEIRTFTDAREQSIMGEVGFHYNFFRRRRFRPYLGAHFTTHLYYKGSREDRFVEGSTREIGLVRAFRSTEYLPIYPDFSLTIGFQYQVTERISAGAFLWANNGVDLWLDAPLGVELRYSLWDRPLRKSRRGVPKSS